MNKTFQ
jgi:hypothetical protein